ncbi:hypothetical protein DD756_04910 [Helicobacter pylori]|nr:hypothetical protein DD756_04910 [Helicobacter pylori]
MELKLFKIPMIRHTEQEPNFPPTSGSPIVFSVWAFHKTSFAQSLLYLGFKKCLGVFLTCCDLIGNQNFSVRLVIM